MNQRPLSPRDRLQELLPNLMVRSPRLQEVSYLRLQLNQTEQGLLPMTQVRESLLVTARQITPVPNMSPAFLGLMSSRNQVFGVIDLSQVLGLTLGLKSRQAYQVVVIDTSENTGTQQQSLLGLAIEKIEGVSRLATTEILPIPAHIPPDVHSAIAGQIIFESNPYLLLDPFEIPALNTLAPV